MCFHEGDVYSRKKSKSEGLQLKEREKEKVDLMLKKNLFYKPSTQLPATRCVDLYHMAIQNDHKYVVKAPARDSGLNRLQRLQSSWHCNRGPSGTLVGYLTVTFINEATHEG